MGNAPSQTNQQHTLILEEKTASPFRSYLASRARSGEPLSTAATNKNISSLQRLTSLKSGLTKRDQQGFTLCHFVVLAGWPEGLKVVIEAKADINAKSSQGYSPLQLAAYLGDVACTKLLIEAGADIEARTVRGSNALMFAAQQGSASKGTLSLLLASGANVTVCGYRNRTALQLAVMAHGRADICKMLTDAGANPSAGNPEMHNNTPLHTAAHLQRLGALKALLAAGADPNAQSDLGLTPLMEVYLADNIAGGELTKRRMSTELQQAGASLNIVVPEKGMTALHFAVIHSGNEATVLQLLEAGIDVSQNIDMKTTSNKNTMLHLAAKRGWPNVIDFLLKANADYDIRNKEGFAALHLAVLNKQARCVTAFLNNGVDPYQPCPDIWPTYSHWKLNRGFRAMEMLMNGPIPLGGAADMLADLDDGLDRVPAVDVACSVIQHIETLEAFLEFGAHPSPAALALAVQCTPILATVVNKPMWSPTLHKTLPRRFKSHVKQLLLCLKIASKRRRNQLPSLPEDALACVLTQAMYPISQWADASWLAAQKIKEPTNIRREGDAAGGHNGGHHQHNIPPHAMQIMPEIIENVLQHIQQQVAAEIAEVQAANNGNGGGGNNNNQPQGPVAGDLVINLGMMGPGAGAGNNNNGEGGDDNDGHVQHMLQFDFQLPMFLPVGGGGGGGGNNNNGPQMGGNGAAGGNGGGMPLAMLAGMAGMGLAMPPFMMGAPPAMMFPNFGGVLDSDDEEEEEENEQGNQGGGGGGGFADMVMPAFIDFLMNGPGGNGGGPGHAAPPAHQADASDDEEEEEEDGDFNMSDMPELMADTSSDDDAYDEDVCATELPNRNQRNSQKQKQEDGGGNSTRRRTRSQAVLDEDGAGPSNANDDNAASARVQPKRNSKRGSAGSGGDEPSGKRTRRR